MSQKELKGDKPKEECGVFAMFDPDRDVARTAFFALITLQHRGQESAGIATMDKHGTLRLHKQMGLVNQAFHEHDIRDLQPPGTSHAIGHTRYSTAGGIDICAAQPFRMETAYGPLAVAHNGTLVCQERLRKQYAHCQDCVSDSEMIIRMLGADAACVDGRHYFNDDEECDRELLARMRSFMEEVDGAFSLVVMTKNAIYGVRDVLGLRPLCIGTYTNSSSGKTRYCISSESCAFNTTRARYLREVKPGEIVRIDENGLKSFVGREQMDKSALCVFEYVYFARPDTKMNGMLVHSVRQKFGAQIAIENPTEADVVMGVPDSATAAALGYANKSGIPLTEGFCKSWNIGRTFIQPDNELRKEKINMKYAVLRENVEGKRVIMVDDSIVRGNTMKILVEMLKIQGGAAEVHVRIASPPVKHPCYMGIDMATYEELIGHNHSVDEIAKIIGADSLRFLSLEGMLDVVREGIKEEDKQDYCNACFSGEYPLKLDW